MNVRVWKTCFLFLIYILLMLLHNNKKHEIKMKKLQSSLKVAIITALKLILYKLKILMVIV